MQTPHERQPDEPEATFGLPIDWHIPDALIPRYATNIVVQHTEHEFVISFFEIPPPILLGSPDEQAAQARGLTSVRAECLARIVVSPSRMPEFLDVLQGVFAAWHERFGPGGSRE